MSQVFVVGGGVAGLTAAHELAERGFRVTVLERNSICGGKARSIRHEGSGTDGRQDLPGEHGFRFFPGFYWHTTHTMRRIWADETGGRTVLDNLVSAEKIGLAQLDKPVFRLEANPPTNLLEWIEAIEQLLDNPSLGIPFDEVRVFVKKLLCFVGSGSSRRLREYERTSWWAFIEAEGKSDAYKNILARGLSRSLVAMKPEKASTLTVASMLVQILVNIVDPPGPARDADRVLNAPTNEAWIDPWVRQLRLVGVDVRTGHAAKELHFDAATRKITGITVTVDGSDIRLGSESDDYVLAVPVEVVQNPADPLVSPELKRAARLVWDDGGRPAGVDELETDWMSGVLFYLRRPAAALEGHVIYANSPWALTSINQGQFWDRAYPWGDRGDGNTRDVLSAIISDWERAGDREVHRPAKECTRDEIFQETWAQLKAHLAQEELPGRLSDQDRIDQFLDPAITFDSNGVVSGNSEPLLINTVNSRKHRPQAKTEFHNFFLASDYVSTFTDLACMEAANEAARHATNALLNARQSPAARCEIRRLEEPEMFRYFRDQDEVDYLEDPRKEPRLCRYIDLLSGGRAVLLAAGVPHWALALGAIGLLNAALLAAVLYVLLGR